MDGSWSPAEQPFVKASRLLLLVEEVLLTYKWLQFFQECPCQSCLGCLCLASQKDKYCSRQESDMPLVNVGKGYTMKGSIRGGNGGRQAPVTPHEDLYKPWQTTLPPVHWRCSLEVPNSSAHWGQHKRPVLEGSSGGPCPVLASFFST